MSTNQILVVDDEVGIRELLFEILRDEGYGVRLAENAQTARSARKEMRPDLVLLDIWMPDTDGITLLKEWAGSGLLTMPVVMMSGHGTIDSAVEATRIGAFDFLEKPISLPKLLATVGKALAGGRVLPKTGLSLVNLGRARVIQELRQRLEQVGRLRTPVLLIGEPGCGFEVCARHLHLPNTPYVAPEETAWLADNPFEPLNEARDGMLFLAGDLGASARPSRRAWPSCSASWRSSMCGSSARPPGPLPAMVEDGHFDADLYHLLSGLTIRVPSLADHPEDIPDIATTMLTQLIDANEVPLRTLTVGALNVMRNLDWPGNLPVLQNVVKTLALTALANELTGEEVNRVAREFNLGPREQATTEVGVSLDLPLRDAREQFEKQYFLHHIRREEGNMSRVADRVGLERTHLYRKLKQLGIRPSGKSEDASQLARHHAPQPHRREPGLDVVGHRHDQHAVVVGRAHRLLAVPRDHVALPRDHLQAREAPGEPERRRVGDHGVGHANQLLRCHVALDLALGALAVGHAQPGAGTATTSATPRARSCAPSAGRTRPAARSSGSRGRRSRRSRACACRWHVPCRSRCARARPPRRRSGCPSRAGRRSSPAGLGSSIEWMSSRKSAASTNGRSSRARLNSTLSRGPSSIARVQTRLKSSSTKRDANGLAVSKRWNAATLAKASVSLPRVGRTPSRSSRSTTIAPQISLPWVSACTMTCGPGLPLSKVWTQSTPVLDWRCGSMSGAFSSTAWGSWLGQCLWAWSWS